MEATVKNQPIKWHGGWTVIEDRLQGCVDSRGKTKLFCWCRCECGVYRIVRRHLVTSGESKSCGCLARAASSERRKAITGDDHANYLGGHWNRGSVAWARKLLRQLSRASKAGGYAPPSISDIQIVRLYVDFSGTCPICEVAVDKTEGRRLCLDHCHETGRVRGFICHHCNACLGWLESRVDKVLSHIKRN